MFFKTDEVHFGQQVNGQRLVYKFVELPYQYKPVKRLLPDTSLENHDPTKTQSVVALPVKKERDDQSDFRVTQEPISDKVAEHVKTEPVSRVIVSKPTSVIVRCGRARALQNHVPTCESTSS
ncbi:hypothetical protein QZH41_015648 [Actinostola sp. cb2023]|nr:hypothetical protein QZH41_015648 [Actinostola sp. cb2023]